MLPDKLSLLFDVQTIVRGDYVEVFDCFTATNYLGYCTTCLSLSPVEKKAVLQANEQIWLLQILLGLFEKQA